MARKKTKDWKASTYSLEEEVKDTLKEISEFEGISQSEMLGFLVKNWDAGINPASKLNMLLQDRKKLNVQLEEIDNRISVLTKQLKLFEDWKKQKSQKKGQAIDRSRHLVLESVHPSPFSANRGFFGNKHFSRCNAYLQEHGIKPVNWS